MKLIALDMDGTLLNKESKLSSYNKYIAKEVAKANMVVLASGRPFKSLLPFIEELSIDNINNYSIAYNGAMIVNNKSHEIIYKHLLSSNIIKECYALSLELNVGFFAYNENNQILTNNPTEYVLFEKKLTGNDVVIIDFKNNINYVKLTFTDTKEKLDAIYDIIKNKFKDNYNVIRSHDYFIEIVNKNVSKGTALIYLAKLLNISKEDIISFGDNENDYTMLEASNEKYVMQNSTSSKLISIATKIVPTNDKDGVGKTLSEIFNIK